MKQGPSFILRSSRVAGLPGRAHACQQPPNARTSRPAGPDRRLEEPTPAASGEFLTRTGLLEPLAAHAEKEKKRARVVFFPLLRLRVAFGRPPAPGRATVRRTGLRPGPRPARRRPGGRGAPHG
jgi:hypothetical protein